MELFPTANIIYRTSLTGEEVLERLKNYIEPEKMFRSPFFAGSTKQYEGGIHDWQFRIKRIIAYRNSGLPRISGIIQPDVTGTTIRVNMKIHIGVLIFLCFWCFITGFAGVLFLVVTISQHIFNPAVLIPFGMMLFGYFILIGGFKHESRKSIVDLKNLFDADIVAPGVL